MFYTSTGLLIDVANPKPQDINIYDIANGLARTCRYSGQIDSFYSVAQHSLAVAHLVPREHALCALLHDATEAYLADLPSPVKMLLPDYQELEKKWWHTIAEAFDLPPIMPTCVREADHLVLRAEMEVLFRNQPEAIIKELGGTVNQPVQFFNGSIQDIECFFIYIFHKILGFDDETSHKNARRH